MERTFHDVKNWFFLSGRADALLVPEHVLMRDRKVGEGALAFRACHFYVVDA